MNLARISTTVTCLAVMLLGGIVMAATAEPAPDDDQPKALAREVKGKGSIVYAARTANGDWDLFLMRPDGSDQRNLTNTPGSNEGLPRFSPDGTRILYRKLPVSERFDNNRHGIQGQPMLMNRDGGGVEALGQDGDLPWASWSPDGKRLACLSPRGIDVIDLETRAATAHLKRKGMYQQLVWSPDGQWLTGVANSFDTGWTVARIELATGAINPVSRVDCCTPDWFPDSKRIIYSNRTKEWTQLWMAGADGSDRRLVYAEDGRHVYGGCLSPDGRYVLFTGNKEEDGDPTNAGAPMGLMRLNDAPIIPAASSAARAEHPGAKDGPVLTLPSGWEPHWSFAGADNTP